MNQAIRWTLSVVTFPLFVLSIAVSALVVFPILAGWQFLNDWVDFS